MATRYYFSAATAPDVLGVAFDAGWDVTTDAVRRKLLSAADGADTLADGATLSWNAGEEVLCRQYLSDRIGVTTIDGTVKCQIRCQSSMADDAVRSRLCVKVVSEDGSVVRGTLLAVGLYGPNTAFAHLGMRNKTFADGDTVTTVVTENGDRILVEIGYSDSSGTTPQGHSRFGSSDASDLPENETTATDLNPWIEFSNTIEAYVPDSGGAVLATAGIPGPGPIGVVSNAIRGGSAQFSKPPKDLHKRFLR